MRDFILKRIEELLEINRDVRLKVEKGEFNIWWTKPPFSALSDAELLWIFERIVAECYKKR